MAVTTVQTLLSQRVKITLQELSENGTRWSNSELINWLNEAYQQVVSLRPDASSANESVDLESGTKQTIPATGLRLLSLVRNTAAASSKRVITTTSRSALDSTRPGWHGEEETVNVEQFIFDDMDPRTFYVYPPAAIGAEVEIIYSQVPSPHDVDYANSKTDPLKLPDSYAPAIADWIMYRAFSKDAEHSANQARATGHYNAFMSAMGNKAQTDAATSPNA